MSFDTAGPRGIAARPVQADTPILRANLAVMDEVCPELAARVRLPMDGRHVVQRADGRLAVLRGRGWVSLELSSIETTHVLATISQGTRPLLVGVGAGSLLSGMLARTDLEDIVAWERDPFILRVLLSRLDLCEPLHEGRFRLLLGADLLDWLPAEETVVVHPLARSLYSCELHWIERGTSSPRVLLATGDLLVDDLAEALRSMGVTVVPWEIERQSVDELVRTARRSDALLVAAINYRPGLAEVCEDLGLPLVCWEIDPKLGRLSACRKPVRRAHIFTYRRSTVREFREAGFPNVRYLPLATNPERRRPTEGATFAEAAPVAFVGESMALQAPSFRESFVDACARWGGVNRPAARALFDKAVIAQRSEERRFVVPEVLEELAPGLVGRVGDDGDLVGWVGEVAAANRRLTILAGLAPFGPRVWGDDGWRHVASQGVAYMGLADHGVHLSRIYTAAAINLDIGRLYQLDIVTMRVFDVLACGGFLLTEHSEALVDLFEPGKHLDTWSDQAELRDKVTYYLAHPELRARIAAEGRAHVVARHTILGRLRTMLATLPTPIQARLRHLPEADAAPPSHRLWA